jgi:hypothetical protein
MICAERDGMVAFAPEDTAAAHPIDERGDAFRRLISFSQGAEWKALISKYIGTIPLNGDAPCAVEHIIAICPRSRTQASSPMIAKDGAAARPSQSAAPRAAALPPS